MPPNTVKVARPSRWGNPYRVGPLCDVQTAVNCFRKELEWHIREGHLVEGVTFRQKLEELRGKNLACFCALDQPCHADALLELANFAGAGGLHFR